MSEKLTKVGEVELDGRVYHVAKNGRYRLVRSRGQDAYGTESFEEFDLFPLSARPADSREFISALIDRLGELLVRLQGQQDLRRAQAGEVE